MVTKPDYHQHEEFINRSRKVAELREAGVEPYPHTYKPTHHAHEIEQRLTEQPMGDSEQAAAGQTEEVTVAGRLVLFRAMGKNAFGQLQDDLGRIQVMFNRDLTHVTGFTPKDEETPLKLIEKKFDLGDIIGVKGHLFRTHKGEITIYAKEVTLLSKTLLPLADKHAGLADKEMRYRKRWLDLISNPDVKSTFVMRSRILQLIREYFTRKQFLEVETPIVQSVYGGAEARPFITKLNALDQEMYLRISLEIPLKKLLVGGLTRVFEMSKVFRNEGIDRTHNPEFTLLEAYAAYWDYNDMMECVEQMYEMIALTLFNTTRIPGKLPHNDEPVMIDLKTPWKRLSMKDAIKEYGHIDVDKLTDEQMRKQLLDSGHIDPKKIASLTRGLLIGAMFEVFAEPHLIQPHHIIDHPKETTPLCKNHRDPQKCKEGLIERFESFIMNQEVCNAYSELNDPDLQRFLLEQQAARRDSGDEEASPLDEEFIEAICQGMPPAAGVGFGVDRVVMLFANAQSIRDVLYFPWMKNKSGESE